MEFEFIAGNLALDFANTVHNFGASDPEDDLKGSLDLANWARQAGLLTKQESWENSGAGRADPGVASSGFKRALRLRGLIYEIFSAVAQGNRVQPAALEGLNSYFAQAMSQASIRQAGDRYELGWDKGTRGMDRALCVVARAAVELLTSGKLRRVRECTGDNCTWLFLDTSRGGRRRWCDMQACGNRAKVRRFRQRNVRVSA